MGNQMSSQDAAAQEAAARSQLATVRAAIATENASHRATMDTLRVQEEAATSVTFTLEWPRRIETRSIAN
jgi:hypothetical protein